MKSTIIETSKFDPDFILCIYKKWLLIFEDGSIIGFDSKEDAKKEKNYYRR